MLDFFITESIDQILKHMVKLEFFKQKGIQIREGTQKSTILITLYLADQSYEDINQSNH